MYHLSHGFVPGTGAVWQSGDLYFPLYVGALDHSTLPLRSADEPGVERIDTTEPDQYGSDRSNRVVEAERMEILIPLQAGGINWRIERRKILLRFNSSADCNSRPR